MIFKSIRLKNFRQYKEDIKLDFSLPKDSKNTITLFIAANGVGKTTLLQAVRYCFYGVSQYLNLPNSSELINNRLVDELKELEETSLLVQVEFLHDNVSYVATRERSFQKVKGKLKPIGEEGFVIQELTKKDGYKRINADAMEVIRRVLPEGLSQVFMFDGERMEQNISDKDFSSDLKSSIIGILGIHKYTKLLNLIGTPGRSSTVLGSLNNRKSSDSAQARKTRDNYKQLLKNLDEDDAKIKELTEKIEDIEKKINLSKDKQLKLDELRVFSEKRDNLEREIKQLEDLQDEKSRQYIKDSQNAIIQKRLLSIHKEFVRFINKDSKEQNYYSLLHVKTIEDIIERGVCVCGRPLADHPDAFEHLEELKKTSLPIETAQYMNEIKQRFNQAAEFKENSERLEKQYSEILLIRKDIKNKEKNLNDVREEIKKIEKLIGQKFEEEIEILSSNKISLHEELGKVKSHYEIVQRNIEKYEKEIKLIDASDTKNKKIQKAMDDILSIQSQLKQDLDEKDALARSILSQHFDRSIAKVLTGDYQVAIDDKYNIKIRDLSSNKDVTTELSTGQNVVVSLSFIEALIATAKEMTNKKNDQYGVLMDAAMSNLDEKHIDKLCQNNLNQMDQLIFLSFKRQLRDEMFSGIQKQIGKAYHLIKDNSKGVVANEIPLNTLEEYIHEIEDSADEHV